VEESIQIRAETIQWPSYSWMTKELGFILGRGRLYFPPAKVQNGPGAHPAYQLPSIKRYHPGSNTARARS